MKKYRVFNIDWDVDNEEERADLPTEIIIEDENDLTNENYELSDFISDAITDETGFCHCGFNFELIEEENPHRESLFGEVRITHIDEDANIAYIDAWKTCDDEEEGRVLGTINLLNKKVSWREETTEAERIDPLVVEEIREFLNDERVNEEEEVSTITDGEWLKYSVVVETERYGKIYCVPRFDADTNEDFFDLYDDKDGYYGELCGVSEEEITPTMVEEQIDENLNL